jgi:uncharacterized protein YceH (UPF0502 family)
MSDHARAELPGLRELEQLVRHLGDELAAFRRRALQAEARVRELESAPEPAAADPPPRANAVAAPDVATLEARIAELEAENAALESRLGAAADRTRQMMERVHFLRQQTQGGER